MRHAVCALAASLFGSAVVAEPNRADTLPAPPVPLAALMLDAEKSSASVYQLLWRSSDLDIERADLPRWQQSDFAAVSPGFVTLRTHEANASSLALASSRDLMRRREEVATRIWDQRLLTTATHAYAFVRRRSQTIGRADAAMNSLGNGVVPLNEPVANDRSTAATADVASLRQEPQGPPIELRYGYLMLNDTAFVTLRKANGFDLTLRRFRLLTGALSGGLADAPTFLSLAKPLGPGLPTPTLTYAVHAPAFELAIAQPLGDGADFRFSGAHDFLQSAERVYFSIAYRF